jgi:ankyrin repeat protein
MERTKLAKEDFGKGPYNLCENKLDNELFEEFHTDILNKPRIERLLKEGANIKAVNRYGDNILYECIAYQDYCGINLETIQYLIDLGADVNGENDGFNCLYMACLTTDKNLVDLLIKNSANVNCVSTDDGESLLDWALFEENEQYANHYKSAARMSEIVKVLKNHGALKWSEMKAQEGNAGR